MLVGILGREQRDCLLGIGLSKTGRVKFSSRSACESVLHTSSLHLDEFLPGIPGLMLDQSADCAENPHPSYETVANEGERENLEDDSGSEKSWEQEDFPGGWARVYRDVNGERCPESSNPLMCYNCGGERNDRPEGSGRRCVGVSDYPWSRKFQFMLNKVLSSEA